MNHQVLSFAPSVLGSCQGLAQFRSPRFEVQIGSSRRSSCSSLRVVAIYLCVCCREKLLVARRLCLVVSEVLVVYIPIRVVATPSCLVQRFINFDPSIVITLHPVKYTLFHLYHPIFSF